MTAPLDLSLQVEISVNGGPILTELVSLQVEPAGPSSGCGGSCPLGQLCYCSGTPPNTTCSCDTWLTAPEIEIPLIPGDQISVAVSPASTANPEIDPSDDVMLLNFDGQPVGWDRRVELVEVIWPQSPCDPCSIIRANIATEGFNLPEGSTVDASFELEYLVNGTTVDIELVALSLSHGGGGGPCGQPCPLGEVCYCHGLPPDCDCGTWIKAPEIETELHAGDEIMVLLRPVPGALPELPGFDENDDEVMTPEPTCQDLINAGDGLLGDICGPNGEPDCQVDLFDFRCLAHDWLSCNEPLDANCKGCKFYSCYTGKDCQAGTRLGSVRTKADCGALGGQSVRCGVLGKCENL